MTDYHYSKLDKLLDDYDAREEEQEEIKKKIAEEMIVLFPDVSYFTNIETQRTKGCWAHIRYTYIERKYPYNEVTRILENPSTEIEKRIHRVLSTGASGLFIQKNERHLVS